MMLSVGVQYVFLSVIGGLGAVFVGMKVVDLLWPPHH
jgi:hypothetical protein